MIARSSSLLLCLNFNEVHYSKSITGINTKLGILACSSRQDAVARQGDITLKVKVSKLYPFLTKNFK